MAKNITIPAVGESIVSATIGQWHKADGEYVEKGEIVLTIETDKISTELEAEHSGSLKHSASEGDEVDIGAVVGAIDETAKAPAGTTAKKAEPAESKEEAPAAAVATPAAESADQKVTPVAKKIAEEKGIDLSQVTGTGAGGKVTKADVEGFVPSADSAAGESAGGDTGQPAISSEKRTTRKKMSPLRKKIADHLVNAQQSAALLTTFNECDMTEVMALRKRVQESFVSKYGVKLGFMSFFIKAVVEALKEVPAINAQIDGDEIVENHFYDIGVAVGTDKGLFVPVIRDCDSKSFAGVEQDIIDYAGKAKEGKIQLEDLQGGVFTISNGGIYGSLLSTPILNPPQSGILGMHTIQQRPVAIDGEVVIRPMMNLALSYDHRLVDGKEAVTFLIRVKECIENPDRMLIGA